MKHLFQLLSISATTMKWLSIAALFGCGASKNKDLQRVANGPFEIQWEVTRTASGAWFNNGGSPSAKVSTSYFSVFHNGTPVRVPAKDGMRDHFWQALMLKDAPRPAVLAGQHSMYLFTEENGQVKTEVLDEQDGNFASYQWLDSEQGQPADPNRVYLGDDSGSPRFLSGGNLLLVNGRTVVDVRTLEVYRFDKDSWEDLQQFGDYSTRNDPAKAFSPDKKQLVFVGGRNRKDNRLEFEYALVVVDFVKNKVYAVPFDQTGTRFETVWDATRPWLETYFEWTKDAGGEELLQLRKLERLPFWQGRLHIDQYAEKPDMTNEYHLFPVRESMLPKFIDFLKQEFDAQGVTLEPVGENTAVSMTISDIPLKIYAQIAEEKKIGMYLPTESKTDAGFALLRRIGERFNEVLAAGKYQEDFGRYD